MAYRALDSGRAVVFCTQYMFPSMNLSICLHERFLARNSEHVWGGIFCLLWASLLIVLCATSVATSLMEDYRLTGNCYLVSRHLYFNHGSTYGQVTTISEWQFRTLTLLNGGKWGTWATAAARRARRIIYEAFNADWQLLKLVLVSLPCLDQLPVQWR